MMENAKCCEYGGRGVAIGLDNFGDHNGRVWWSDRHNSYVMVPDEKGNFLFKGKKVQLLSINGIGEIRWNVEKYDFGRDNEQGEAIEAFGLVKA